MTRLGCLLLCLAVPAPGFADELLHARSAVYGCSEPGAAWTANQMAESRRIVPTRPIGRCFAVRPAERWERIAERDGLLLLRRTPAVAGEPPLYFRSGDVAAGAARRPDGVPASGSAGSARRPDPSRTRAAPDWPARLSPVRLVPVLVLVLVASGVGGRWLASRWRAPWRRRHALGIARAEIARHQPRLQIKRFQLVGADDYGTVDVRKWQQEKGYFCKTRVLPLLSAARLDDQWPIIETDIDRSIERAAAAPPARVATPDRFVSDPQVFDARMDPIDYERHCALLLRKSGWTARVTAASGDQGADVLARRNGTLLVVQCKLYRSTVGNAAVQQVSAARLHQRAQFAAVVSNARFTAAARQLARTNGVYLLHHEELRDFRPA